MTTGHCESSLGSFDELQNSTQAAVDPQTKPPDLGCESACRLLSSTTTIAIYYYYSARKADTHLPSHGGQKAELTQALQEGCTQPVSKAINHGGFYDKHNCPQHDSIPGPRALQSGMLPLDHCDSTDDAKAWRAASNLHVTAHSLVSTV